MKLDGTTSRKVDIFKLKFVIALMMEAVGTSETSVSLYQTTRRNIPEDESFSNQI
jgi:hypothetical protein